MKALGLQLLRFSVLRLRVGGIEDYVFRVFELRVSRSQGVLDFRGLQNQMTHAMESAI